MSVRLITTEALTAEADALRALGISGNIEFKENGFIDAIESVEVALPEYDWDLV